MAYLAFLTTFILLGLSSKAGAVDIQVDAGLVKNGWIEYSPTNKRLPQCCTSKDCTMVKISKELLDKGKESPLLRLTMTDPEDSMSLIMSYDPEMAGFVGKVYKSDGMVYFLEPVPLNEREEIPCYVAKLKNFMFAFHKLTFDSFTDGDEPRLLFEGTLAPPTNKGTCCTGSFCKGVTEVIMEVLKNGVSGYPDLYIPRNTKPSNDLSEMFSLSITKPPHCKSSLCDVYIYSNPAAELLKISVAGDTITAILEANEGGQDLTLKKCKGKYVWTEKEEVLPLQITAVTKAAPGPDCWNPHSFCSPLYNVISHFTMVAEGKTKEELVMECMWACQNNSACAFFTFFSTRSEKECHLLTACQRVPNDKCQENCVSGPSDCTPVEHGTCDPPPDLGPDYIKWQCLDLKANRFGPVQLNSTLPPGTLCMQSCGTWRTVETPGRPQTTGYLESRCEDSGQWSKTVSFTGESSLDFPAAPYPAPDATRNEVPQPLSCGCEDLKLSYDPSTEEGAVFSCKRPANSTGNGLVISTGNVCHLWCSGIHSITLKCSEEGWTGEPEEGIYCYVPPIGPAEPTDEKNNPSSGIALSSSSTSQGLTEIELSSVGHGGQAHKCLDCTGDYRNGCGTNSETFPWMLVTLPSSTTVVASVVLTLTKKTDDRRRVRNMRVSVVNEKPPKPATEMYLGGSLVGTYTGPADHTIPDITISSSGGAGPGQYLLVQMDFNDDRAAIFNILQFHCVNWYPKLSLTEIELSSVGFGGQAHKCLDCTGDYRNGCGTNSETFPWMLVTLPSSTTMVECVALTLTKKTDDRRRVRNMRVSVVNEKPPKPATEMYSEGSLVGTYEGPADHTTESITFTSPGIEVNGTEQYLLIQMDFDDGKSAIFNILQFHCVNLYQKLSLTEIELSSVGFGGQAHKCLDCTGDYRNGCGTNSETFPWMLVTLPSKNTVVASVVLTLTKKTDDRRRVRNMRVSVVNEKPPKPATEMYLGGSLVGTYTGPADHTIPDITISSSGEAGPGQYLLVQMDFDDDRAAIFNILQFHCVTMYGNE